MFKWIRKKLGNCAAYALIASAALSSGYAASDEVTPKKADTVSSKTKDFSIDNIVLDEKLVLRGKEEERTRWYFMDGLTWAYPNMKKSEAKVDAQLNGLLKIATFGNWDRAHTFADERDYNRLITPFMAVAYQINDNWDVFMELSYARGKVRTDKDRLVLGIPMNIRTDMMRSSSVIGIGTDFYPLGAIDEKTWERLGEHKGDGILDNVWQRLKETKPFITGALDVGYPGYSFDVKLKSRPFGLIRYSQREEKWWWDANARLGVGTQTPLWKDMRFATCVGYNWYLEERDFNGITASAYVVMPLEKLNPFRHKK